MRLWIWALAAAMIFGAYGVWKYAKQGPAPVVRHESKDRHDAKPPTARVSVPAPTPPRMIEAMEPIAVMPEALLEEPFESRTAGTTVETPLVRIPAVAAPRFDAEGETKLRMPRADEAFDWAKIRERLRENSVLVFFDPLPVLPQPERIIEESEAPPR